MTDKEISNEIKDSPEDDNIINHKISFDDDIFKLSDNVLRGVVAYGFEYPSKIQLNVIPKMNSGIDLIVQSQSGTGKTGSFVISILNKINIAYTKPQTIILTTTRELADQICNVVTSIGQYLDIKVTLCVGGTDTKKNYTDAKSSHILIGTPGRVLDMINKRIIDVRKINTFVMDEADELLKNDFVPQVKDIILSLPKTAQMCIFSATFRNDVLEKTTKFMNEPVKILIEKEELTLDKIKQFYIDVGKEEFKISTVCDLYEKLSICQCIIFVNGCDKASYVADEFMKSGYSVGLIHGKMNASDRNSVMIAFRKNLTRVLVSTDILSRGIDVQQVGIIINYDIPRDFCAYLHRIGRSGRYGKYGVSINLITRRDFSLHRALERYYKIDIEEMPPPDKINKYLNGDLIFHMKKQFKNDIRN